MAIMVLPPHFLRQKRYGFAFVLIQIEDLSINIQLFNS